MTAPTTAAPATVGQIGEMLRRSMPPFEMHLQEYTILNSTSCRHWPEGCYIQVTVHPDGVASTLEVQIIIQELPGSALGLHELLQGRRVVLQTGEDQKPAGEIQLDSIDGSAHTAEFDLHLTDIKPGSYLAIA
jgi:hypothetical protein